ncbi:hypothetical protein [Brevibacillus brevis]|uniref:hypothetical protein n=1 Tax=Brevibacillus brevis TaxID=1393 RepID=UPI00165D61ED|nr:hypothetical protein [Brevibacillus brevis]
MYEHGTFDKTLFSSRLQELQAEMEKYYTEKSRLEFELREDNSSPVSYERVYALISQFDKLIDGTTFEQRKMLLHMVIKKITLNKQRKIENIELIFDESTEKYFSTIDPSVNNAEGV